MARASRSEFVSLCTQRGLPRRSPDCGCPGRARAVRGLQRQCISRWSARRWGDGNDHHRSRELERMAGCETKTEAPGNYDWSADRITAWALIGGAGGATWAIIELIGTTFGWEAALAVAFAFLAGAG